MRDMPTTVERSSLRDRTEHAIRALIVTGELAPNSNVIERALSHRLGVSRTPLREALHGLTAEGLLRSETNRGFFVPELSLDEARELYPLIATLEAFTVETGRPDVASALDAINARFRAAPTVAAAIGLDREWHEALVAGCRRPRTADILKQLRSAAERYEYRFLADSRSLKDSARQHAQIARLLRAKQVRSAAQVLRHNWLRGLYAVERAVSATQGVAPGKARV